MEVELFGNGLITLPRLMGTNNHFFKIIAEVFPPWYCVNALLNTPKSPKFCFYRDAYTGSVNQVH